MTLVFITSLMVALIGLSSPVVTPLAGPVPRPGLPSRLRERMGYRRPRCAASRSPPAGLSTWPPSGIPLLSLAHASRSSAGASFPGNGDLGPDDQRRPAVT